MEEYIQEILYGVQKQQLKHLTANEYNALYCVSCIKSMHIGGKTPRHLMDLLLGETTEPQVYDTVKWHEQLEDYIDKH